MPPYVIASIRTRLAVCPYIDSSRASMVERDKNEMGSSVLSIVIIVGLLLSCAICACCYCYVKKYRKK